MKCPPVLHNVKFINDLIMERKLSFSQFASIAESQILDDAQMNAIEAGDSCTQSCKNLVSQEIRTQMSAMVIVPTLANCNLKKKCRKFQKLYYLNN